MSDRNERPASGKETIPLADFNRLNVLALGRYVDFEGMALQITADESQVFITGEEAKVVLHAMIMKADDEKVELFISAQQEDNDQARDFEWLKRLIAEGKSRREIEMETTALETLDAGAAAETYAESANAVSEGPVKLKHETIERIKSLSTGVVGKGVRGEFEGEMCQMEVQADSRFVTVTFNSIASGTGGRLTNWHLPFSFMEDEGVPRVVVTTDADLENGLTARVEEIFDPSTGFKTYDELDGESA
ncbi:hypothetical protein HN709_03920 [Candidatus Peregrinibacteria bacterium]|jgi:hypothetical protein|nr:hypothetical protein [Candidatus Peregrinibacteria bacterium]MBT7736811.1 hypothetical protein [Candidatus Peregrinibacteria bacterium]